MRAMNVSKAAFGTVRVLDDPSAMGVCNATSEARKVLDRTGLVKKKQVEVTANTGGMFILPLKMEDGDLTQKLSYNVSITFSNIDILIVLIFGLLNL